MNELAVDGIPVTVSCRVLKLARAPYYRRVREPVGPAERLRQQRVATLQKAHDEEAEFGYRLLADDARDEGFPIADRLRRALRISGTGVATMAEYLGAARTTVSNWINGRIVPNKRTLRVFALRTGVPFEWLETGHIPTNNAPDPDGTEGDSDDVRPLGLEPRTH